MNSTLLVQRKQRLIAKARRANIEGLSELSEDEIAKQLAEWEFISWNHYYAFFVRGFGLYLEKLKKLYTTDCLVVRIGLVVDSKGNLVTGFVEYNIGKQRMRVVLTKISIKINGGKETMEFSSIHKKIQDVLHEQCKDKNRIIIGIVSVKVDVEPAGHASVFIFNKRKKAFIYYDPHGSQRSEEMAIVVRTNLSDKIFNSMAYTDLSLYSDGIQRSDVADLIKEITGHDGFCYAWSALVIETALNLGPNFISVRNIVARLGRESRMSLAVKLLRFVRHVSKLNVNNAQIARAGPKGPGRTWEEVPVKVLPADAGELKTVFEVDDFEDSMRYYYKAELVAGEGNDLIFESVQHKYLATQLVSAHRYLRNYYDQRLTDDQYDKAFEVFYENPTKRSYLVTTIPQPPPKPLPPPIPKPPILDDNSDEESSSELDEDITDDAEEYDNLPSSDPPSREPSPSI